MGAARAVDVARLVGAVAGFPNGERDVVEGAIGGGELDNVGDMFGGCGPFGGADGVARRGGESDAPR